MLAQADHCTTSKDEDTDIDKQLPANQEKGLGDIFALAARVARRSDTVLAAVQTSVRHHLAC